MTRPPAYRALPADAALNFFEPGRVLTWPEAGGRPVTANHLVALTFRNRLVSEPRAPAAIQVGVTLDHRLACREGSPDSRLLAAAEAASRPLSWSGSRPWTVYLGGRCRHSDRPAWVRLLHVVADAPKAMPSGELFFWLYADPQVLLFTECGAWDATAAMLHHALAGEGLL